MKPFTLKNKSVFSRAIKRLRKLLSEQQLVVSPEFRFDEAMAYVLGYPSYEDYEAGVVSSESPPSQWDEELSRFELDQRRSFQLQRFTEFFARHGLPSDAAATLLDKWRPTSSIPQASTHTGDDLEKLREQGVPERAQQLLESLERSERTPTSSEIDLLRLGLRSSSGWSGEWMKTYVGPLGARLVNLKQGPAAQLGFELLEALQERGDLYVKVNLAKALAFGWGTEPNHNRAWALAQHALKEIDLHPERFLDPRSHIALWMMVARLCEIGQGCPRDRVLQLKMLELAAAAGYGPAALRACYFYLPLRPGEAPDECNGVVEPNGERALAYFQQALAAGYDPEAKAFPPGTLL